ncbi:Kiwa anti-phage protein KwaB-like domain-containing protein [Steroidobacter flavus]|uniref:Kiwa anti-phage protein KwaB-like domain-containing protein n=1 Tax=Steroidobacter flavus TaxID=1842136 RepID=A0ABV8SP25_9GAMM
MNFFALLNIPGSRIRRIDVAQDVQNELSSLFATQQAEFMEGIVETIPLDGAYTPEPHELMYIDGFDDVDNIDDAIREPIAVSPLDVSPQSIDCIVGLFSGEILQGGSTRALLQVFDKRRSLARSGYTVIHRDQTFRKLTEPGLTFDSSLSATLEGGRLCFRSLFKVRRLFDVDGYFKEATNEDLQQFSQHALIEAAPELNLTGMADTWIRRKVALISASGLLNVTTAESIKQKAAMFDLQLTVVGAGDAAKVQLPANKKDLKTLLKFLNDDYYESPLTETRYVSSSKRKLPQLQPA